MGFSWVLMKVFLKALHNIKYNYIVPNIICFQTQK